MCGVEREKKRGEKGEEKREMMRRGVGGGEMRRGDEEKEGKHWREEERMRGEGKVHFTRLTAPAANQHLFYLYRMAISHTHTHIIKNTPLLTLSHTLSLSLTHTHTQTYRNRQRSVCVCVCVGCVFSTLCGSLCESVYCAPVCV